MSKDKMNDLFGVLSNRLGVSPDQLKESLDSGKVDSLASKMPAGDMDKLKNVLKNPEMAKQILATPQAQELLKHLKK